MELNLSRFADDMTHMFGFGCLCFGAGCSALSCAPSRLTYLAVLAGYADGAPSASCRSNGLSVQSTPNHTHKDTVCSRCSQFQVVLDWTKETRDFPRREVNRLDVLPGQHPANAVEGRNDIFRSVQIFPQLALLLPDWRLLFPAPCP
jgi:hypothetical protein